MQDGLERLLERDKGLLGTRGETGQAPGAGDFRVPIEGRRGIGQIGEVFNAGQQPQEERGQLGARAVGDGLLGWTCSHDRMLLANCWGAACWVGNP
jgi:hypothetical protein